MNQGIQIEQTFLKMTDTIHTISAESNYANYLNNSTTNIKSGLIDIIENSVILIPSNTVSKLF